MFSFIGKTSNISDWIFLQTHMRNRNILVLSPFTCASFIGKPYSIMGPKIVVVNFSTSTFFVFQKFLYKVIFTNTWPFSRVFRALSATNF
jgi:hypothetical protein